MVVMSTSNPADCGHSANRRKHLRGGSRYRMLVAAPAVDDIVHLAGGFVYDSTAAGWDVGIFVAEAGCQQPLRILGAQPITDLDGGPVMITGWEPQCSDLIVVHPTLYENDIDVRRYVKVATSGRSSTRVVLCGPHRGRGRTDVVEYRYPLSAAAQAFKKCAMSALHGHDTGLPDTTEIYCAADSRGKRIDSRRDSHAWVD